MAHTGQERYSKLVLAKLRASAVLKDGVVFNNDYEGDPRAGAVKIPVRDVEVAVSDYDKASGLAGATGTTTYETLLINKDKAVNEIIDGYDAEAVPDGIVAERLDSAGYALAMQLDNDGAAALLAGGTAHNEAQLTKDSAYAAVVDLRTALSKANVPMTGRYLLATPDFMALLLKCDAFVRASALGDTTVQSGMIGKIAGFDVYEYNSATPNLQAIAGHPKYAARVNEFSVPVHLQNLAESGKYIGASAVQGRMVYAHKVLRAAAVRALYAPGHLAVTAAASDAGKTILTVTGTEESGTTLKYTVNPAKNVPVGDAYAGAAALTSGTTKISAAAGDVIEVAELSGGKVVKAGYHTVKAAEIGS